MKIFINNFSMNNTLGSDKKTIFKKICDSSFAYDTKQFELVDGTSTPVFYVKQELPQIPSHLSTFNSRNNRLILLALEKMEESITNAIETYGAGRIGIIFGTSTSGIDEGVKALKENANELPAEYLYTLQEMSSPSEFIKEYFSLKGIAYTISTACTSGARSFIEASYLLKNKICDVVIVGGSDSVNELTLNGFHSLEAISHKVVSPFSRNRSGINIGEGAAIFLLSSSPGPIEVLGMGHSSDGFHPSAPHPQGLGAIMAMEMALEQAGINTSEVDYINLHGTGTIQNDQVESLAIGKVFNNELCPASSTKPFIGHCLGSAGAQEVGICALLLSNLNRDGLIPPQVWNDERDDTLEEINFAKPDQKVFPRICMTNSYAFGGNNVSLILGKYSE